MQELLIAQRSPDGDVLCQCCECVPCQLPDTLQLHVIQAQAVESGKSDCLRHFLDEVSAQVLKQSAVETMA